MLSNGGSRRGRPWFVLNKVVFLETFQELSYIALDDIGPNSVTATDFIDDFEFGPAEFQHSEDLGSHDVEGEHVTVMDVQDDASIGIVSRAYSFRNS